ncbi:glutaredoxin domain-containing cysteine-rich protein 1-like isoform X2 [Sinocyclocheilus anshuiensis]|uniref:glutaredoxin domain-containing cysteine-rich protein 1-like isoform X2 n=1 Tax=Sinocyclocheilus anshuiensis TaxID=1608454 RepID=UPI0007B8898A|nr:PREDICTED: glutaredoxin domain-containing cysteine-rich protein 1-like isoform X2 [Sinocyclocheilus anshuiensis]
MWCRIDTLVPQALYLKIRQDLSCQGNALYLGHTLIQGKQKLYNVGFFDGRMERRTSRAEEERAERRVRFRVASAHSGRVLQEVFREHALEDSADTDTDTTVSSEPERSTSPAVTEANSHLSGPMGPEPENSGSEPDELLMYASASKEKLFTGKRVNIFSKNGTIRGVRDKVSAGQVLFNNLSQMIPLL